MQARSYAEDTEIVTRTGRGDHTPHLQPAVHQSAELNRDKKSIGQSDNQRNDVPTGRHSRIQLRAVQTPAHPKTEGSCWTRLPSPAMHKRFAVRRGDHTEPRGERCRDEPGHCENVLSASGCPPKGSSGNGADQEENRRLPRGVQQEDKQVTRHHSPRGSSNSRASSASFSGDRSLLWTNSMTSCCAEPSKNRRTRSRTAAVAAVR